uniref:DRBM domain-containing protein n=1 Tax=Strongyloides papillosus TaxID=174720 RepID=A0A0N5BFJ6_STREA
MIVDEVHSYSQYLKLPFEFTFELESDGLFLATYTHNQITAIGRGKSKKIAKEEACKNLKPFLQSFAEELSGSTTAECLLKDLVQKIGKSVTYVENMLSDNNIQIKCIVGEHETYATAAICEVAKVKSIKSMLEILSSSIDDVKEKINWADMEKFLDGFFFKMLLQQICDKNSWDLSFHSTESNITREYYVSCKIKSNNDFNTSVPPIEDIKYNSVSKTEGENSLAREICLKYFNNYNDNIYALMKIQLDHRVQKFYDGRKVEYKIERLSMRPSIFKCYCDFSKLSTEGIHAKKKVAQGIAAWKMLKILGESCENNNLKEKKDEENKAIQIPICTDENMDDFNTITIPIDPTTIEKTFRNYHSYLKDILIGDFKFFKSKKSKYILLFKYILLNPKSDTNYCRILFGVGSTKDGAIKQGCDNLYMVTSMKKKCH